MGNKTIDGRNEAGVGGSTSQVPRKEKQIKGHHWNDGACGFPPVLPTVALPWIFFLLIKSIGLLSVIYRGTKKLMYNNTIVKHQILFVFSLWSIINHLLPENTKQLADAVMPCRNKVSHSSSLDTRLPMNENS